MRILLTNDDGIHAPGLSAFAAELAQDADVCVVAPATEQSGVGHSITFLSPLVVKEVFQNEARIGWAVEGSPADCVKLGIFELCGGKPDLVVSGINGGSNAGINVLYSGTVAAAIEGAFFGITSIAVSLEYNEHADFPRAAQLGSAVIRQILKHNGLRPNLFNVNIPIRALNGPSKVRVVPMSVAHYGENFEKRTDPRGRSYYWATNDPPPRPSEVEDDLTALAAGCITVTPLHFDLTQRALLEEMGRWEMPDV